MERNYEIIENLGSISYPGKKWQKELNIISWLDNGAKYDIRAWNSDHTKMGKGITLDLYELRNLKNLLNQFDI